MNSDLITAICRGIVLTLIASVLSILGSVVFMIIIICSRYNALKSRKVSGSWAWVCNPCYFTYKKSTHQ